MGNARRPAGRASRDERGRRRAFRQTAVVLALGVAIAMLALPGSAALTGETLPASVKLEGWDTVSSGWTPGNTIQYAEGQAIPFRLDLSGLDTSKTYLVNICREFNNGARYGFLFLEKYNATISLSSSQVGGTVADAAGAFATVAATVSGVEVLNDAGGVCGPQERLVQVTVKPTGATSYLLWGGHLASPIETVPGSSAIVGFGNGAGSYPGSSLAMRLVSPDKTVPVPVDKIVVLSRITVKKIVVGGTAKPEDWSFTISGPSLPAGYPTPTLKPGTGSDSVEFLSLPTGTYTITESNISPYALTSVTGAECKATQQELAAFQGSASVEASTKLPKEALCVFTNIAGTHANAPAISTLSNPTGGGVVPGTSVTDSVTADGPAGPAPGTVTFFLCQPHEVSALGCTGNAGTKIGAVKTLDKGKATSDPTTNTNAIGTYCWRAEYTPGHHSPYAGGSHTNATTECFTTVPQAQPPSSISVTKTGSPSSVQAPGGNVTFTVDVKNTSAVDNVFISSLVDSVFGNLDGKGSCDVSPAVQLAPGQTYSCEFTEAVNGSGGTTHTNEVTASGVDDGGDAVSAKDSEVITITSPPAPPSTQQAPTQAPAPPPVIDVAAQKTATPQVTLPANGSGALITYGLVFLNNGPNTAMNVTAADPAPSGVRFVAITQQPSQGTCAVDAGGSLVSCALGTLVPGQSVSVQVSARATVTGTITNIVTVAGEGGADSNPANNTAQAPTLVVAAVTPPTPAAPKAKPKPRPKPAAKPKPKAKPKPVAICNTIDVAQKSLQGNGKRQVIQAKVTQDGKAVKGAKVLITGPGIRRSAVTPKSGVVRIRVAPKRAGILRVAITNRKACNTQRISVVPVFEPPLTG